MEGREAQYGGHGHGINDGVAAVVTPCAACRVLRRKCSVAKCVLAPYFPPSEPQRFLCVHRVFGASNIIRMLQEIAEDYRADAVKSLVYEATARVKDPVYGSSGVIYNLHRRLSQLQSDVASTRAELLKLRMLHNELLSSSVGLISSSSASPSSSSSSSSTYEQEQFLQLCAAASVNYSWAVNAMAQNNNSNNNTTTTTNSNAAHSDDSADDEENIIWDLW